MLKNILIGIKIVYPNFIHRCVNWNSGTIHAATTKMDMFLKDNISKQQNIKQVMEPSESEEKKVNVKKYEKGVFPLIETNVLLLKGSLPPCISCKFMHPYLKRDCSKQSSSSNNDICYVKKLGFLLLDFAEPNLIRTLLSNNRCK